MWRLQRGVDAECRFFQSFADQGHYQARGGTRQGIYVCSPGGKLLASACDDDTVKFWDPATGRLRRTMRGERNNVAARGRSYDVEALAFSHDGKQLALGCADGSVELWDPATGEIRATLSGVSGRIRSVAFGRDARRVFSGGDDRTISVWDSVAREELLILRGHEDGVRAVTVSPDGRTVATASLDGTIKLWETAPSSSGGRALRRTVEIARRVVDERSG